MKSHYSSDQNNESSFELQRREGSHFRFEYNVPIKYIIGTDSAIMLICSGIYLLQYTFAQTDDLL